MPNRHARLLNLLLGQTGRDAHLQRRLQLPVFQLAVRAGPRGHALQSCDEDAVVECLFRLLATSSSTLNLKKKKGGRKKGEINGKAR